jgi:hypothetical protein
MCCFWGVVCGFCCVVRVGFGAWRVWVLVGGVDMCGFGACVVCDFMRGEWDFVAGFGVLCVDFNA